MHIFAFDSFFQLKLLRGIWESEVACEQRNKWLTLQLTARGEGWSPEEGLLIYSNMSSGLTADPTCGFNHLWVIKTFAQPPT